MSLNPGVVATLATLPPDLLDQGAERVDEVIGPLGETRGVLGERLLASLAQSLLEPLGVALLEAVARALLESFRLAAGEPLGVRRLERLARATVRLGDLLLDPLLGGVDRRADLGAALLDLAAELLLDLVRGPLQTLDATAAARDERLGEGIDVLETEAAIEHRTAGRRADDPIGAHARRVAGGLSERAEVFARIRRQRWSPLRALGSRHRPPLRGVGRSRRSGSGTLRRRRSGRDPCTGSPPGPSPPRGSTCS